MLFEEKIRRLESLGIVVSSHSGKRAYCICPWHSDTAPSLVVYLDQNSFYCFGCKRYGRLASIGLEEGVDWDSLCEEETEEKPEKVLVDDYGFILLGEAPERYRKFVEGRGFEINFLNDLGVCAALKGKYSGRVVFPISDRGFTTRYVPIFKNQLVNRKVLHSDSLDVKREFYDLRMGGHEYVVVTEGVFDSLSYRMNEVSSVAILGSALHRGQVRRICDGVQEVVLSFDGDEAGRTATRKALMMFPGSVMLSRVTLPDGLDPDDCKLRLRKLFERREVIVDRYNCWDF